jgi:hypothetical protein
LCLFLLFCYLFFFKQCFLGQHNFALPFPAHFGLYSPSDITKSFPRVLLMTLEKESKMWYNFPFQWQNVSQWWSWVEGQDKSTS